MHKHPLTKPKLKESLFKAEVVVFDFVFVFVVIVVVVIVVVVVAVVVVVVVVVDDAFLVAVDDADGLNNEKVKSKNILKIF